MDFVGGNEISVSFFVSGNNVLGDKWTLVVMRDALFFGARTYFAGQKEGIRNLLAQQNVGLAGEDNVPTPPAAF